MMNSIEKWAPPTMMHVHALKSINLHRAVFSNFGGSLSNVDCKNSLQKIDMQHSAHANLEDCQLHSQHCHSMLPSGRCEDLVEYN